MEWAAEGEFPGRTSIRCYLFILRREVWPVQLVDGHHDGHHVFTIHDGDGNDVLGLILSQLIHKVTEMRALWEEKKRQSIWLYTIACPLTLYHCKTSSLNFDEHTTSIHKCCKQRLPIIWKLKFLSAALHLLLLLCSRGHQLCSARGEKQKERLINCQEGAKTCRERCLGDWNWWQSAHLGEADWHFLFRCYFILLFCFKRKTEKKTIHIVICAYCMQKDSDSGLLRPVGADQSEHTGLFGKGALKR